RAARLLALECVAAHELRQLEEVGHASRVLERLIELGAGAGYAYVAPELVAELGDEIERLVQPCRVARHAAILPHDLPELAVDRRDGAAPVHGEQALRPSADVPFGGAHRLVVGRHCRELVRSEIVAYRLRNDEVAVGQALHQCARAKPIAPWSEKFASPITCRPGTVLIRL